ncbi:MAG: PaaI family thioesterase [Acidobacteria bacterium]|nr:PaaI family thioesterase [Acidobacteriota bacterium]
MSDTTLLDFPNCFVCGSENPVGLHVTFTRDGEQGCRAEYVARSEHVGWPGLMHGGLLFTLMDEAVAWAICFAGLRGVTGKAEVRFRRPATVGTRLIITGTVADRARRAVRVRAEIRRADEPSQVVADMDAMMVLADVGQWQDAQLRD